MGRAVETSGAEDDSAEEDAEDDADESARKKRKVVLVKAAATKRRGDEKDDSSIAARNRPRPASLAGGTAGRVLAELLGQRSRAERPAERSSRPVLQREQKEPKEQKVTKPSTLASAAAAAAASTEASLSRSRPSSSGTKRMEASRPSSTTTLKASKKTTTSVKTEVKKPTLSKRATPSGASGKKALVATHRSASPGSETGARKGSSKASAGVRSAASRPARTKVKVKTASAKKVVKAAPGKAGTPAGNSSALPASAGAAGGGMSAKANDSESSASCSPSKSRSSSSSRSPSPAPRAQPVKAPPPARPVKRPRTTPASPKQVKKASPLIVPGISPVVAATPLRRPVLSAADEGSFQDAVLDRLRTLCGENEDAKVLAEYIVVMVAGNKGRDEMSAELKPFFQEQTQADAFVDWVEECKWKFLTGGPSPAKTASSAGSPAPKQQAAASSSPAPRSSPPADFWGPAPTRTLRLSASSRSAEASSAVGSKSLRHGPHVAVTSRCVLQPNPNFDDSPSPPRKATTGAAFSKAAATSRSPARAAAAPAVAKPVAVAAPSAPAAPAPARGQKNELLDTMTKQLQLILTKLQDKTLPDESREKYQTMAQSIQTQMAKIAPKKQPPVRGRR